MYSPSSLQEFASSGKHAVVGSYIETVFVVGLYGSHGVLLLTIQVHRNLVQIKVLEIEGIPLPIAVVCRSRCAWAVDRKTVSRD